MAGVSLKGKAAQRSGIASNRSRQFFSAVNRCHSWTPLCHCVRHWDARAAHPGGTVARQSQQQAAGFAKRFAGGASSAGHSLRAVLASASSSRSRSAMRLRSEIYCLSWKNGWSGRTRPCTAMEDLGGALAPVVSFSLVSISAPHSGTGDPHVPSVTSGGDDPVPSIAPAQPTARARCPLHCSETCRLHPPVLLRCRNTWHHVLK